MAIKAALARPRAARIHRPVGDTFFSSCKVRAAVGGLAFALLLTGAAAAESVQGHQKPPPAVTPSPQAPTPKVEKPAPLGIPSPSNLFIMIRTTLIALHQANVTGNYSVLRDLGAPDFQQANSAERLSAAFANLRTHGGDIAPVVLALPTLLSPPAIDRNGMLRLTGWFDTKPNALFFDLVFQSVDGFWRLDGIGAQFRAVPANSSGDTSADKKGSDAGPKTGAKAKSTKGSKAKPQ